MMTTPLKQRFRNNGHSIYRSNHLPTNDVINIWLEEKITSIKKNINEIDLN